MFPLPMSTYIYAGLILISIICFGYGRHEHNKYVAFKAEVEAVAKVQEAKVESIKKQQELVTKGIEDEYKAKLALLRNYYANSVRNPGSGPMPTNPFAPIGADAVSSYNVLAGQCAETTLMLVELQKWLREQVGIK